MSETNKIHVSPGVYATEQIDMKAAANSIGITKLALVGETLKGPAFQPYWIHSPKEYASVFGGTNPAKFKGSNYPKYELPYIAGEYLKQGTELCVVRTLGFSGYSAGPAWVIYGNDAGIPSESRENVVIAVLRSRAHYGYRKDSEQVTTEDGCKCDNSFDSLIYEVGETNVSVPSCNYKRKWNDKAVKLFGYTNIDSDSVGCGDYSLSGGTSSGTYTSASINNLGKFTITCFVGPSPDDESPTQNGDNVVNIPVSLNKGDNDYILNVLGTTNDDGDMPLFVESLYDKAWEDFVMKAENPVIRFTTAGFTVNNIADFDGLNPVDGILPMTEGELSKKDLGKRFLYSQNVSNGSPSNVKYYKFDYTTGMPEMVAPDYSYSISQLPNHTTDYISGGQILQVSGDTEGRNGYYEYYGGESMTLSDLSDSTLFGGTDSTIQVRKLSGLDLYQNGVCEETFIYTVRLVKDNTGKTHYVYSAYDYKNLPYEPNEAIRISVMDRIITDAETLYRNTSGEKIHDYHGTVVLNKEDGLYYSNDGWRKVEQEIEYSSGSFTASDSGFLRIYNVSSNTQLSDSGTIIKRNFDGTWSVTKDKSYDVINGPTNGSGWMIYDWAIEDYPNKVVAVETDLNDYKSQFRYASTPWVVSNAKGDASHIEVNKLFRFHTISDGTMSNTEVKVSIENIRPDSGEFDVVVRAYGDIDSAPVVLERFVRCTMAQGQKYIGYMIGTSDGTYESKSKYIMVEMADSTNVKNSVPCGFIGYSIPKYNGRALKDNDENNISKLKMMPITYNTAYYEDLSKRKQYFGLSDIAGYDVDYFTFKGNMATLEAPGFVTNCFHLDCRMNPSSYSGTSPIVTVDGVSGYTFDTVSVNARTSKQDGMPIIGPEQEMAGSIFEDIRLRKFTMLFAGGFDGWDIYRDQRTNTDDYAYTTYKGYVDKNTGNGYAFDVMADASIYGIEEKALTSDYYSTLAGVSLLKNPDEVDINLLATPGIDTLNNIRLVNEVFDILDDRADTFYVVTTPDKQSGLSDYADDIPDVSDIAYDFEDSDVHSDYAATYYPWVKIEDAGEYVWLPPTRDVVRNLAESDNKNTTMNLAPAGTTRGKISAIKARKNLKNGEADMLYDVNINPVRTYANDGIFVMGQKTLRKENDLANRVDVRRMVMRMRKLIAIGCLGLIFEPNDNATVKAFKKIINGIMQGFMDNRAIDKWSMDVDDSQEARDRLELNATIYVKPIRALEYITLNFVVTNNDVYFEN